MSSNLAVSLNPREFQAGSLIYTRSGLVVLFGWLLWGDFVFTIMEAVIPKLLPLLLKDHGATNSQIAFLATSLHMAMNAALNPFISFQSDRLRTPWGRRRPFIFFTTPLVVLFLAATPYAPELVPWLGRLPGIQTLINHCSISPVILVFGLLSAGFQLFNTFISSVYYYVIRDVVPEEVIGRFLGLFRIFGHLASLTFSYFVFGLAETHMKEIFVVIALAYGIFILLMCWRVQEGAYPPPPRHGTHWWHGIVTYLRECFGHRYYWWVFVTYSALGWGAVGNAFSVFFYREDLQFSLDLIGKMESYASAIFILLSFPFGVLMDRWGCHKTLMLGLSLALISSLLMYALAINQTTAIIWTLVRATTLSLCSLALVKWTIEVYPKARYGQFGSAGALFSSIGGIICATAFGHLLDWVKAYRIFLLWHAIFAGLGLVGAFIVHRKWKALGGRTEYCPP